MCYLFCRILNVRGYAFRVPVNDYPGKPLDLTYLEEDILEGVPGL